MDGMSLMFKEQPLEIRVWSILETDRRTPAGPFFSAPLEGDRLFETGSPASRPFGVAPM